MQLSSVSTSPMNSAQEAMTMAAKARPENPPTEAQAEAAQPPEGTGRVLNAKA